MFYALFGAISTSKIQRDGQERIIYKQSAVLQAAQSYSGLPVAIPFTVSIDDPNDAYLTGVPYTFPAAFFNTDKYGSLIAERTYERFVPLECPEVLATINRLESQQPAKSSK